MQIQGVFVDRFGNYSKRWIDLVGAKPGSHLGILVENRGRQTIETINDFKVPFENNRQNNIFLNLEM